MNFHSTAKPVASLGSVAMAQVSSDSFSPVGSAIITPTTQILPGQPPAATVQDAEVAPQSTTSQDKSFFEQNKAWLIGAGALLLIGLGLYFLLKK